MALPESYWFYFFPASLTASCYPFVHKFLSNHHCIFFTYVQPASLTVLSLAAYSFFPKACSQMRVNGLKKIDRQETHCGFIQTKTFFKLSSKKNLIFGCDVNIFSNKHLRKKEEIENRTPNNKGLILPLVRTKQVTVLQ